MQLRIWIQNKYSFGGSVQPEFIQYLHREANILWTDSWMLGGKADTIDDLDEMFQEPSKGKKVMFIILCPFG